MDRHFGHLIVTEDLTALPESPSSAFSPLPSLSAPSTSWENFNQWRNQILRKADESVVTSVSISTRINEDPDQHFLFDNADLDHKD